MDPFSVHILAASRGQDHARTAEQSRLAKAAREQPEEPRAVARRKRGRENETRYLSSIFQGVPTMLKNMLVIAISFAILVPAQAGARYSGAASSTAQDDNSCCRKP